jgi:hypothetical protein
MQKFKHVMRELQGAILMCSVFQIILGYTGLMSLFLRYVKKPRHPTFTVLNHATKMDLNA